MKPLFDPWACLLVAPGLPLGAPGAQNEVMLDTACVSQSKAADCKGAGKAARLGCGLRCGLQAVGLQAARVQAQSCRLQGAKGGRAQCNA